MAKHLVLVGGGHAHLTVLKHIDEFINKGHRVTVIGPSRYHYYSGMGPGMLSGIYREEDVRFHIKRMAEDRNATFVQGRVVRIDAKKRRLQIDSGEDIDYDVLSVNTGSYVPNNGISESEINVYPVKPIENLLKARKAISDKTKDQELRLLVVGGGPAGLELTGNLWRMVKDNGGAANITFLVGRKLMSSFPEKVRKLSIQSLSYRGIRIEEGANVQRFEETKAVMEDGREFPYDFALLAWGIKPSPVCRESGLPTDEDGGLFVNEYLQSIEYPEIFGGGDCICFQRRPLDKVGVYPVRENPILYHNLLAAVTGGEMISFEPQDDYLLIFNLGDGTGLFWKKNWIWKGRLGFFLKDYIDRKFMKNFQISGERDE
jgi:NADH dehydrogenase FAD-containing subunit